MSTEKLEFCPRCNRKDLCQQEYDHQYCRACDAPIGQIGSALRLEREHEFEKYTDLPHVLADLKAREEWVRQLREALQGVMTQIAKGALVRETAEDASPGWVARQIPLVMALQRADEALRPKGNKT